MNRPLIVALLACAAFSSGCAIMEESQQAMRDTWRLLRPSHLDPADAGDTLDEDWVRSTGVEARGERPHEQADWIDGWIMSPKAKSIEENFGIAHE